MQCMKFLGSNLQNPSQKFHKNLFDFEKPQILQKSPKLRFQNMKWKRLEAYQVKKLLKKLEETLRRRLGVRLECLGEKR